MQYAERAGRTSFRSNTLVGVLCGVSADKLLIPGPDSVRELVPGEDALLNEDLYEGRKR